MLGPSKTLGALNNSKCSQLQYNIVFRYYSHGVLVPRYSYLYDDKECLLVFVNVAFVLE